MSFVLSNAVDTSKVFLAKQSQLESRWDPNYYRYMRVFREKIKNSPFPIERLKRSLTLVQYGISERATEEPVGVAMLRMINLQEYTWDLSSLKYLPMTEKEKKPYLLKHGDILFNRTNSKELVGKCNVFNLLDEYVFASYLIRVRLKRGTLLPEYVTAFLSSSLGRIQIDAVSRQIAGMTNINAEEIRDFYIPALDEKSQKKVVETWHAAIEKRDKILAKAHKILTSIDDVLLAELGIPQKPESTNTIESRIFRRAFSRVTGNRIDPAANWKKLSFENNKYPLCKLCDIVALNPATRFSNLNESNVVSFVPMDAVSEIFGDISYIQTRPIRESGNYTIFQEGDIIWAKITPCMENGKSAIARGLESGYGYGSTEFHVFRPKTYDLSVVFLHHLLRLQIVRQHARLYFTGSSGHQRVDEQFFYHLEIPFPPVAVQERIASIADDKIAHARELFAEANAELENAKQEIESLILGKGNIK